MAATANEPSDNSVLPQYKILTLEFNQNCTAFSMGTMTGYKLFSIQPDFKLDEIYDCQYKDVRIIERLFSSSLIAIVSDVEPRKMRMIHYKLGTEICVKLFPSSILSIKLNRDRLVICLEDCLYIYDIHTMELVQRLYEIAPNEDGLFALSPNTDNPYLAYPASSTKGGVQIVNTANKTPKILIPAHDGPLAAIAFDPSGTKIATASTKGTVIRVHSVLDGNCLSEVRRGTYRATIYSLAFSPDSAFLAVSSSSGTIHIFRLVHPIDEPPETATWTNTVTSTVGYVGSYFSKQVTEVLTQDRAYSIVHLQSTTVRTTIAMANFVKRLILFVAGYDGTLIAYEVNTNERGDCRQIHQQIVFNLSENSNQTNDGQPQNERKNSSATTKDAIKS